MGESEDATGLSILNPTPEKIPGPSLLHDLIRKPANQNELAVDFLNEHGERIAISYGELDALSDRLSQRILQALCTLPTCAQDQFIIPLMIPQSPDLYVSLYAILKSGAAFCPLNLDAPADRIRFILKDINASLILTTSALSERISAADSHIQVICVDDAPVLVHDRTNHGCLGREPATDDLAYVMYTSGSTGTPKGVGISHAAATQSLLAHDRHIPVFSRFLQFAAPTFDVSVFEIFFPLFRGSTLVCCNRADMLTDLPGIIRKLDVDACELTPSVAGSLLKTRAAAPNLKLVLTIGEMLTKPVVEEFGGDAQIPSILWGMYGPTEAAIHCTLQPSFARDTSTRCIGIPLDTVSAFVTKLPTDGVDAKAFEIVPLGEVGELVIGGHQLAQGYLNRSEQTAASFIETCFGRVYKTGDKARMLPDGTIECLGRVSEGQVKLNGQRMELGEVEHVILRTEGCHSAFVCVISNVLVAFAAVDSISGMRNNIIASCKRWLPSFMIPSEFVIMDAFPRLPSGKIDRMRLKEGFLSPQSDGDKIDPGESQYTDELEEILCNVAQDVLQMPVRTSTRLVSVGVDSLSAIQLATQLRDRDFPITPLDVLDSETLGDLHNLILTRRAKSEKQHLVTNGYHMSDEHSLLEQLAEDLNHSTKLKLVESLTSCTPLQTSMLAETFKNSRLYVNIVEIKLPQDVSPITVKSWFQEVALKNEVLRSGFVQLKNDLKQVIWKELPDSQTILVDEFSKSDLTVDAFLEHPFRVEIQNSFPNARITLHHAIYDGWTMDLLLDDLNTLAQGKSLPDRPQFRQIAPQLNGSVNQNDQAKEFWAEHLQGVSGSSLPNFKTTAVSHPDIETVSQLLSFNPHVIQQETLESGISPQAVFQATLMWLWSFITASDDITIGSVFSGRTLPISGIERTMGPCISTLPIRTKLAESGTIHDLTKSIHATNRNIMRLNPITLAEVKKAAGMPHGSRLFDVLFVYQESLSSRRRGDSPCVEISHEDHIETKLLLEVEPYGDSYSCRWTYHTDVFSLPQVQAFMDHFSHIFAYLIRHPDSSTAAIRSSFPPQSLSTYTRGYKHLDTYSSLADLVERRSSLLPDVEALCFAHSITASSTQADSITYKELNQTANQIARHLIANGASNGGIIAIVMEKSILLYCCILGILKAGCAYLPLLPSTPPKRVKSILEQAQPQICIVEDAKTWKNHDLPCAAIDLSDRQYELHSAVNLDVAQDPSQLAYVIFTSGTTGTPKGVSVTNKNMLSNIEALSRIYPLDGTTRMLQACSQAFDVSVFEIFFAWANNMCLCAATNDTLFEDLELSIRQLRVTHLSMTVTVASLVNPENVPDVQFLVTSGEPMTDEVLQKWESVLYQGYGPSETTNICTVRKVFAGDSSQYLGWSLDNTSSFVFYPDSDDLVPIGGLGELCFGGDQVAAGYLNMPELTAEKFFQHSEYGRLYRSGDMGRMLPDGSLIILGRLDTQIKLRGQRIELREIQSLVLGSSIARVCACITLKHNGAKSQQLVLFYVPASEDSQRFEFLSLDDQRKEEVHSLFRILESSLPGYMVPSFIIPITCLPLTSSGKTNTDHLRQSAATIPLDVLNQHSLSTEVEDKTAEWTETEKYILDALAATLDVDKKTINRWTWFATLGLDSISAMKFSRHLQATLGRRIPISQILQNFSISRLAQSITSTSIQQNDEKTTIQQSVNLLPDELIESVRQRVGSSTAAIETMLPCTPLQAAMLASTMSSSDRSNYYNQMLFRIEISTEDMVSYWNQMRLRHGILRTCFVSTEDHQNPIIQVVFQSGEFSWSRPQTLDLQQSATEHLQSLCEPVDTFEPPISLAIISTQDSYSYLSFVCHHSLYDGVAVGKLLSEIESLARGETLRPAPRFQDFLQEILILPQDTDDFWDKLFEGFYPSHLPQDHDLSNGINGTNSLNGTHQSKLSGWTMPLSLIQARLRENGVSLLSLCQAAWSETLSTVVKTSDVCFGNVFSGRSMSHENISDLVAPCFNTVPVRMNLLGTKSHRDLMKACQSLNANMLQYQFTPLRKIRAKANIDDARLFDTLLLLQPPAQPFDSSIWSLEQDVGSMDVPIVCEITPFPQSDRLDVLIHRDSLVSESLANLLHDVFICALDNCLAYPASQLELLHKLPSDLQDLVNKIPAPRLSSRIVENGIPKSPQTSEESWSKLEDTIRYAVAKLSKLPLEHIGRDTSIYRLGLDSINAIQLSSILRLKGLKVSPVDILENPTCAGIASRVQNLSSTNESSQQKYDINSFQKSISQQVAGAPEAVLPCTPLQQGMLSQFILSEGANYYNFVSWSLNADTDCETLSKAWCILQARHQILRTGFVSVTHVDTSFAMVLHEAASITAPVKYLKDHQAAEFNLEKWRRTSINDALSDLYRPPWQVVIAQENGSTSMHLGMHHALFDAISLQELLHELRQILKGEELGPVIPIETAVGLILGEITNKEHDSAEFWKAKASSMVVNSFPTLTPLRVDRRQRLRVSRPISLPLQNLRASAAVAGVTIQAALQSAWIRLLSSYHGDSTVTFGVVLSGRTIEHLERAAFPCITTLPVIATNSNNNRELLRSMMDYNVALRRNEHTPLTKIQKWTGYAESPIFDTILVYQQGGDEREVADTWQITNETATVDYPVSLEVEEVKSDSLRLSLDFRSDLIPVEHADLLLAQFDATLVHLLCFPDNEADDLISENHDIYSILHAEYSELPTEARLLHQFVEQTTAESPEKLALEFVHELGENINSQQWNYRQLDEFGNKIAHLLTQNQIKPGGIVAVCFDKCPEAYFTILGILKTGCAFVALDPGAPPSRHQFILEDSGALTLIVQKGKASAIVFTSPCPVMEVDINELGSYPATALQLQIAPEDACYCLYTSGTTGTPKGCIITHENAVQAMLAFQRLFDGHWDNDSRWLQFASFHFDVSVLEQYWSWSVGIPVISASRDLILSDLISTISMLQITHIDLTPSLARLVHPDEVPSLCKGVFITGGEQLRQDILDAWGAKEVIYNAYGPTEATIGVTMYCRVPQNGRSTNIGKQFPNVGSFVLRPGTDVPVLKGGIGELCVSGKLVGKGYLNRDDLTNERFPILSRFGERVYRTGDLVRVLYDGCFDFLGRADDQVKLRGQRLEVGEINHAIKAGVSQIVDVATLVTKHQDQDRDVMVSFIVSENSNDRKRELSIFSDQKSLDLSVQAQDACRAKLPGYMIPTYVFCIPHIPLSANNKAQTSILKQLFNKISPDELRRLSSISTNGGTTLKNSEPELARIIATIINVDANEIKSSATIFEVGFDSISVIELARQLRTAGFLGATPSIILQNPRLGALSKVLRTKASALENNQILTIKQNISACYHRHLGAACREFGVTQVDIEYIAPCTSLQEGMLTRSLTSASPGAYFNSFRLEIIPETSIARIKRAWEGIVEENCILRTGFLQTPDGYVQVALKHPTLKWHEAEINEDEIDEYLNKRFDAWVRSNASVLRNPLEIDCIQIGQSYILNLRIFHGVYDARSFAVILQQLKAFYENQSFDSGPKFIDVLPHGPLCDYSPSKPFWEDLFLDFIFQPTPSLVSEPSTRDSTLLRSFDISSLEAKRIEYGVTQQTIIQAAWASVLRQHLQSWPSMGIVVSGRSLLLDKVENTIGPLFNTLPFRIKDIDAYSWLSIIQATHQFNASSLSFAHIPLRQVQKWCSNGQRLFDNLFTFDREEYLEDVSSAPWTNISSTSIADYPLAFEGIVTHDHQLKVTLVAQSHVADEAALNGLLNEFQRTVDGIVSDDGFPIIESAGAMADSGSSSVASFLATPQSRGGDFAWTEQARLIQQEIATLATTPIDQIAENTTLFELGLDSIDAVKLVSRLRRIGISLMTSQLMKHPSIKGIMASADSNLLANDQTSSATQQLEAEEQLLTQYLQNTGFEMTEVETVLPPTPLQDAMVAEMVVSRFQRYFNHNVLEISPDVDIEVLKSAIKAVVKDSPILRTVFIGVDDPRFDYAYCQVILEKLEPFRPAINLESIEGITEVMEDACKLAANSNGQSALLQITPVIVLGRNYLVLSIAHALYDGTSLDLFHRDIQAAYQGVYHPKQSYKNALARVIASSSDAGKRFWSDFLHDAYPTLLTHKISPVEVQETSIHRFEVPSQVLISEIKSFCMRKRITTQVLGQACWAAVLATLAQSLSVTFGVVLSGRATEEEQKLMFPTMNTVPVRAILHGQVAEYLQYLWENFTSISEFQFFPLRKAQKFSKSAGGPLFNTLFTMQTPSEQPSDGTTSIWKPIQSASEVEYPLCVEMEIMSDKLVWTIACDEQYFSQEEARSIIDQLDVVLRYLLSNENGPVMDFESIHGRVSVCGLPAFALQTEKEDADSISTHTFSDEQVEWTQSEAQIIEVLAEISGVDRMSILPSQSIYHLGLDSISAIKASSVLRKRGIVVSVRDMVRATSIRDIAPKVNGIQPKMQTIDSSKVTSEDILRNLDINKIIAQLGLSGVQVEKVLPALPMQVHMLSVWENTKEDLYFYEFSYDIIGEVSQDRLSAAWQTLVAESPVLRTYFAATGSCEIPFVQVIAKADSVPSLAQKYNNTTDDWKIELQGSPFTSLQITKTAGCEAKLSLKIHHALYDGVSLPMIVERLRELCGTNTQIFQSDVALWDQFAISHYATETRRRREAFWKTYLQGSHVENHAIANPVQTRRTAEFRPAVVGDLKGVRAAASARGISLQSLFFAAYAKYLSNIGSALGAQDVVFGIYLANRTSFSDTLRDLPYPTLAIVPLRVKFDHGESLAEIAKRVQEDLTEISSFENASVGLWEIAEWTGINITSFVNFLSLPNDAESHNTGGVQFKGTTPTVPDGSQRCTLTRDGLAKPSDSWLSNNPVKNAYVDAIDIEAAVRGDTLDIGIFGSSFLLSNTQASDLIDCIVELLRDIS